MANEVQFDRRTILTFAFGGPTAVTLAAGMFGVGVDEAFAGQGATRAPARTVRRIVTAHNAEGKSFIAVDDSVPMADIWRTQPEKPIGTVPGDEKLLVGRATGETRFFLAAIPPSTDPKPNLQNRVGFHRTGGMPTATSSTASLCSWSTRRRSASKPATWLLSATRCTRGATSRPSR